MSEVSKYEKNSQTEVATDSLSNAVVNPFANGLIEAWNTVASLTGMERKKLALRPVHEGEFLSAVWIGQTISGGLGQILPYAAAAAGAGSLLKVGGRFLALEGRAARIAASPLTANIVGASAYDFLKQPQEGENRAANAASSAVGFGAFEAGGLLKRSSAMSGITGLGVTLSVGLVGGALQHASRQYFNTGQAHLDENLVKSAVGGAVINASLPALHKGIATAGDAINTRLNRGIIAERYLNRYNIENPEISRLAQKLPLVRIQPNAAEWAALPKKGMILAGADGKDVGKLAHEWSHIEGAGAFEHRFGEIGSILKAANSDQTSRAWHLYRALRLDMEAHARKAEANANAPAGQKPALKSLSEDIGREKASGGKTYEEVWHEEFQLFQRSPHKFRPAVEFGGEGKQPKFVQNIEYENGNRKIVAERWKLEDNDGIPRDLYRYKLDGKSYHLMGDKNGYWFYPIEKKGGEVGPVKVHVYARSNSELLRLQEILIPALHEDAVLKHLVADWKVLEPLSGSPSGKGQGAKAFTIYCESPADALSIQRNLDQLLRNYPELDLSQEIGKSNAKNSPGLAARVVVTRDQFNIVGTMGGEHLMLFERQVADRLMNDSELQRYRISQRDQSRLSEPGLRHLEDLLGLEQNILTYDGEGNLALRVRFFYSKNPNYLAEGNGKRRGELLYDNSPKLSKGYYDRRAAYQVYHRAGVDPVRVTLPEAELPAPPAAMLPKFGVELPEWINWKVDRRQMNEMVRESKAKELKQSQNEQERDKQIEKEFADFDLFANRLRESKPVEPVEISQGWRGVRDDFEQGWRQEAPLRAVRDGMRFYDDLRGNRHFLLGGGMEMHVYYPLGRNRLFFPNGRAFRLDNLARLEKLEYEKGRFGIRVTDVEGRNWEFAYNGWWIEDPAKRPFGLPEPKVITVIENLDQSPEAMLNDRWKARAKRPRN